MVFKRLNKNKMENKELLKLVIETGKDFLAEYFFNNFDYVVQSQEFKNIDELLEKFQKYMERHITETIKAIQEVDNIDSQEERIDNEKTFNKEFITYLAEKAIGDTATIIEEVNNASQRIFCGYVNVTKTLDENNRILLKYVYNGDVGTAKWLEDLNYAKVYNSFGEAGYMLLPTNQYNVYFLMFYKE